MTYYGLPKGKNIHYYLNNDTLCKAKSSGSLKHKDCTVLPSAEGKSICKNCLSIFNK